MEVAAHRILGGEPVLPEAIVSGPQQRFVDERGSEAPAVPATPAHPLAAPSTPAPPPVQAKDKTGGQVRERTRSPRGDALTADAHGGEGEFPNADADHTDSDQPLDNQPCEPTRELARGLARELAREWDRRSVFHATAATSTRAHPGSAQAMSEAPAATEPDKQRAATVPERHAVAATAVPHQHAATAMPHQHAATAVPRQHAATAVPQLHAATAVSQWHAATAVSHPHAAAAVPRPCVAAPQAPKEAPTTAEPTAEKDPAPEGAITKNRQPKVIDYASAHPSLKAGLDKAMETEWQKYSDFNAVVVCSPDQLIELRRQGHRPVPTS